MALPKKNALFQTPVVMVDKTDFATIESAVVAASLVGKFYGFTQGGSAAMTSGTISKAFSLVRSGIFRMTAKATEVNYDRVLFRVTNPSCADQLFWQDFADSDDSDMMSALTVIQSMASDAASAAQQANSRVLVVQSFVSDIRSHVSDLQSDFQSRVPKRVATDSQLSDLHSDLRSFIVVMSGIQSDVYSALVVAQSRILLNQSRISDIYSLCSDLQSDFQSRVPKRVATDSQLSDMASDLKSAIAGIVATVSASDISDIASAVWANTIGARVDSRILVGQSFLSDIRSHVSDLQSDFQSRVPKLVATGSQLSDLSSDLKSAIAGITLSVSASDISDIASAVRAGIVSDLSDILSAAVQGNSRALVAQSYLSDIRSHISDLQSDFQSRVPKRVATDSQLSDLSSDVKSAIAAMTVALTASDISDIASAVKATLASDLSDILSAAVQVNSRVLVGQSYLSDIRSHVSDLQSDFQSRVPKRVATDSQLSDMSSDVKSAIAALVVAITASDISDIASAVWANAIGARVDSRILVGQSFLSDIRSHVSDLQSDFQSRVPKLVATNSQVSDLASDLKSAIATIPLALSASDISDISSQVWAHAVGVRVDSRVLVAQSFLSDIRSHVSDLQSDFQSRVPKLVATSSQLSDLSSDVKSAVAGLVVSVSASDISDIVSAVRAALVSDLSDILSAAVQGNSRALVAQSYLSDIRSHVSDLQSDFQSRVPKRVATDSQLSDLASDLKSAIATIPLVLSPSDMSDIASQVWAHAVGTRVDSRILVGQSILSDIRSHVSDLQSDFQSRVPKLVATNSQLSDLASDVKSAVVGMTVALTASDISDIASAVRAVLVSDLSDIFSAAVQTNSRVLVAQSYLSDLRSHLSDLQSDFQSRVPKLVATNSQVSDLSSDLKSAIAGITVTIGASDVSDIASAVLAGLTGLSASDISNIASAVQAILGSDLSDILSAAQQTNSRALIVQSMASDIRSHVSDLQSDFQSRVPKEPAARSQVSDLSSDIRSLVVAGVGVTVAAMSDISSRVWTDAAGVAVSSRLLLAKSSLSDILSAIAAGVPIGASDMSDLRSAIAAGTLTASAISDIASAVWADPIGARVDSRVLVVKSAASDIYSLASDLHSDFQSRVPKRVATDSQLSALASDVLSALDAGVPIAPSDMSDLRSAIVAGGLTASTISDIASAVAAELASNVSDILSGVRQTASRALVIQSHASDIYSLLSDLHSDVGVMSGVVSDIHSGLSDFISDFGSALAEPTTAPSATPTVKQALAWMHALSRNKITQTASVQSLRNDADGADIASTAVSDDLTTFIRNKWGN